MAEIIRGAFMPKQQETPPPQSCEWLVPSKKAIEQNTGDKVFPTSHRGTASKGYSAFGRNSPAFAGLDQTRGNDFKGEQRKKKLFVGMAPKSAYEDDYRTVFAPFGNPVDIHVIRDRDGFSKGCAFVKYESTESAYSAMEALHGKYIMPGGYRTLVVTIADFRREPNPSRYRDAVDGGDSRFIMAMSSPCTMAATTLQASGAVSRMPCRFRRGPPSAPQGTYAYYPFICSSSSDLELSSKLHHSFTVNAGVRIACQYDRNSHIWRRDGLPTGAPVHCNIYAQGPPEGVFRRDADKLVNTIDDRGGRWAKQAVGPSGANIFIYYLPKNLSDAGLAAVFAPFGKVLSVKIYRDRVTLESKGFGFVSYGDPDHAELAISRMDGFFIGQKRLKVVQKRGEERAFGTRRTVNINKYGIPLFDGGKNGDRISSGGSSSRRFNAFGWGSGGDTSGQSDLQDKESLSDAFNQVTPESLLGLSMAR